MRRSNPGCDLGLAAFRPLLAFAVILFFSSNTVAQHSSGGGGGGSAGGGGGSSSGGGGGGGGSHGGGSSGGGTSGGGSSSSGGGRGSGGSGSSGSAGHGWGGHGSSGGGSASSSRSMASQAGFSYSFRVPNNEVRGKTGTEKRGFFSILRHPFRKPASRTELRSKADLRGPICVRGPCRICRPGWPGIGGCGGTVVARYAHNLCAAGASGCRQQNYLPNNCNAELMAMERQAHRMHAAEAAQTGACSVGSSQDCSDQTTASQSEASLYRASLSRYRACMQRSFTMNPFIHYVSGYSRGFSSYPLNFDLEADSEYR